MSSDSGAPESDIGASDEKSADCFYCGGTTDYHPQCDRPGCENHTHGTGPEGKLVKSYCHDCRPGETKLVTDGGLTKCATVGCHNEVTTHGQRCSECRRNDLQTDGGTSYEVRVDELYQEAMQEVDNADPAETMVYARCCAAIEVAVNDRDVNLGNALGVMTAALRESAEQGGFPFEDVLDSAREIHLEGSE
jgi:hypothetical protein